MDDGILLALQKIIEVVEGDNTMKKATRNLVINLINSIIKFSEEVK